ncbi:efflux RND transporter periplasmic adaptor subunit [Sphingobacterium rhinopitheci]|uniref:efflux RND transporter periplasmic adaptor subunit n=1 Tax=Sphingobacterium rhinopitheci TaxID=2781960 RepID=UPI001F519B36|nr:efflux RND transporter periplasmic adaptor subunit [Sphingobacterium rhinopitheci]MCI0921738.1 efflux RND transporter periplasmic adaptor subunit [Sphingobacterium rhinopitheci]
MRKQFIILISAALLITSSCASKADSQGDEITDSSKFCLNAQMKENTLIEEAVEQTIADQLTLTGKVSYDENNLVSYKSLIQGIVVRVDFELGDLVQKGQVLSVVKSTEIQGLLEDKRTQMNNAELLRKQLAVKKELLHDGLASQPEVSDLEYQLKSIQIEIDRISKSLRMYRSIGDGQFQIIAPQDGYIVQKDISVGQSISVEAEYSLFSISNLNRVWVMANIYANNLKFVQAGDLVQVRTVAYPDRIYPGRIDKIYHVFDNNEHVTKARVVLENQDLSLSPGLSADIIISKKNTAGKAFAFPKKAVIFVNNNNYVVVYKDDCNLAIRKVTPITGTQEYIFVEEKFQPNEKVITSNALLIFEELNK